MCPWGVQAQKADVYPLQQYMWHEVKEVLLHYPLRGHIGLRSGVQGSRAPPAPNDLW